LRTGGTKTECRDPDPEPVGLCETGRRSRVVEEVDKAFLVRTRSGLDPVRF